MDKRTDRQTRFWNPAGAGRDVASMVDNEHLKYTATLPQYITLESAVSQTNSSALLLA